MEQEQEAKPKKSVGRPKKELSEAQKEALERGRLARAEKARKDREDKERLKEQEKEVDRVILQRASKGQELRQKMAELKKQMEELEGNQGSEPSVPLRHPLQADGLSPEAPPIPEPVSAPVPIPAPSAVAPPPGTVKEVPDDVQEPDQEEPEKEEIKVVRRIAGKGKGKKVIMIDASIFEDDDEPVQVKRVGGRSRRPQPLRESRYKADRRTRFADDDIEEEEEDQEEYDEEYDNRRPVRRPVRRQDDFYREQMRDMNTMNDSPHHHSNMAPPLAPLVKQVYTHQQLREENPLYSMIFGK